MAVAARDPIAETPLLFEPDQPPDDRRVAVGWRRQWRGTVGYSPSTLVRRHEDDEFGARLQRAIARYHLSPYSRSDMARDLGVTVRHAQAYLSGQSWAVYSQPVLRALRRLGISPGRGRWAEDGPRAHEVIAAQRALMARAAACLEGIPPTPGQVEDVLADLWLLAVAGDAP